MVGSDRPTIRDLNNFVVPYVGSKWYMLSFQLLDQQYVETIQSLKKDNRSAEECCAEMLTEWLRTESKRATWNRLIDALHSPSIKLHHLANKIQKMLVKTKSVSTYRHLYIAYLYHSYVCVCVCVCVRVCVCA